MVIFWEAVGDKACDVHQGRVNGICLVLLDCGRDFRRSNTSSLETQSRPSPADHTSYASTRKHSTHTQRQIISLRMLEHDW